MQYTFAIQWPAPFAADWQTSNRRFHSTRTAATALADYLAGAADNGTILKGKLVILE